MRSPDVSLTAVASPMTGDGNLVKPCREDVYKLCPGLAERWESNSNFTQWTLKIRDNVLWHDGTPFTAEDAKFWVDLSAFGAKFGDKTRTPAFFGADLANPEKVEILSGNRLQITLSKPSPLYLEIISTPHARVFHPKHLMQPRIEKGELNVSPQDVGLVGAGPFKFLEYQKGSFAKVRRFDKYWEKDAQGRQLPFLGGIDYALMADPTAMDAAFRVGKLDMGARGAAFYLSAERKAAYDRDLGDTVRYTDTMKSGGTGFGFNVTRPGPWQDVRIRRAISLWLDREEAVGAWYGGVGYVTAIMTPDNPFSDPEILKWPGWNRATKAQDRAEAKRLLADAGYAKGFTINFLLWNKWIPYGENLHAQLRDLGIELKLNITDDAGWNRGRLSTDWDAFIHGVEGSRTPEATENYMTRHSLAPYAVPKHEDQRVVELYNQLRVATNFNERAKVYREIERYIVQEKVYFAPIVGSVDLVPYRSYLKGLIVPAVYAQNNMDLATVWLDK
jgi:peptide/nickel transport system substrate-binding protein